MIFCFYKIFFFFKKQKLVDGVCEEKFEFQATRQRWRVDKAAATLRLVIKVGDKFIRSTFGQCCVRCVECNQRKMFGPEFWMKCVKI